MSHFVECEVLGALSLTMTTLLVAMVRPECTELVVLVGVCPFQYKATPC